jgi:hypothetical protein
MNVNNVFFSPKRVDISLIDHFHPKQKSYPKADTKMAKPAGLQNNTFDPKISLLDSQGSRGELCSRRELTLSFSSRGELCSRGELKLPQFPCFASFIQNLPYYDAAIQSFLIQKFYKTNKYVK